MSIALLRNARRGPVDIDLPEFARTVLDLARDIDERPTRTGLARDRYGRKVFLSAVRRALRHTKYAGLPRRGFNTLMLMANQQALLMLARADLPQVMDPKDVRDSEIDDLGSTFHFVVAPQVTERNARISGNGSPARPFRGAYRTATSDGRPRLIEWELWRSGRDWRVNLDVDDQPLADGLKPSEVESTLRASELPRIAGATIHRQISRLTARLTETEAEAA